MGTSPTNASRIWAAKESPSKILPVPSHQSTVTSPLFKSLTKVVLGLLAGTTLVAFALPEAMAQTLQNDTSQEFQKEGDPIYGGTGQSFSVFDLIHRSNLGGNRSYEDFVTDQKENLDEAAAQFRSRQRQRLQIPAKPGVPTPANTNTEAIPTQAN